MEKFVVGNTYFVRSNCNHECIFSHEILNRTAKSVLILIDGDIKRRKVEIYEGEETIYPYGKAWDL